MSTDIPLAPHDRVLLLGDGHGNLRYTVDAIRLAAHLGCDAVVSVGDFGIAETAMHGDDGGRFVDACDAVAAASGITVLVVPGNHDNYDAIAERAASGTDDEGWIRWGAATRVAPRPHLWEWHGRVWMGVGGTASPDGPGGIPSFGQHRGPVIADDGEVVADLGRWWSAERITPDDVAVVRAIMDEKVHVPDGRAGEVEVHRARRAGRRVDVLITHDVPLHVPMGTGGWDRGHQQRRLLTEGLRPVGWCRSPCLVGSVGHCGDGR